MQDEDPAKNKFDLTVADGTTIHVRCPVCEGEEFGTAGPQQDERRLGFQHVIVGREFEAGKPGRMLTSAIRFRFCLNCGFVLKFMFLRSDKDRFLEAEDIEEKANGDSEEV